MRLRRKQEVALNINLRMAMRCNQDAHPISVARSLGIFPELCPPESPPIQQRQRQPSLYQPHRIEFSVRNSPLGSSACIQSIGVVRITLGGASDRGVTGAPSMAAIIRCTHPSLTPYASKAFLRSLVQLGTVHPSIVPERQCGQRCR